MPAGGAKPRGAALRLCGEVVSLKVKVLYEDNHIIAVIKPFNMPSQADATGDMDMLTQLKEYIRVKYEKPGEVYLGLVHRLDRPAGGVMVFARTSKAAARLSEMIRKGEVEKTYLAVLQKKPAEDNGELAGYMIKDEKTNISRMAGEQEPGAKQARLAYEVLSCKDGLTLAKIRLFTGRSHQIRVQMASIGCPLAGDMRYGKGEKQQLALWALSLSFIHPVRRESITIQADPPVAHPWSLFF
jgi:23S rRNA pseudouridine1911/1915/1917 synthase